jgi:glycosyltransferase involved in cell wall biosynthesis
MLSVVIPALNSASTVSYTLSSIFSNRLANPLFEVLLIDNGSSDATVEVAKKFPVKICHCATRGIGPPRNLGIKVAEGEIVCFTDSDCIVEKDWLKKISEFFESNPEADAVGGPVIPWQDGANKIQKNAGEVFLEDHGFPQKRMIVQFGNPKGLLFGTNSAYRKEVLLSSGGYEKGGSSLELSWRLASGGKTLIFDPAIRVYHVFPWNLSGLIRQQHRWGSQMTQLRKKHNVFHRREIVLFPYFLVRDAFSTFVSACLTKNILRLVLHTAHFLGRIDGTNDSALTSRCIK